MDIPVEFFIVGVVAALYTAAWLFDSWGAWQWRKNGKDKEAEHVTALAVQLYLAKGYERERCFLLMNKTPGLSVPQSTTKRHHRQSRAS